METHVDAMVYFSLGYYGKSMSRFLSFISTGMEYGELTQSVYFL
jgi:hypothetical protein